MSTNVSTPPDRSLAEEGSKSLEAQLKLAPDIYAARQQYDPLYAGLNTQTLRTALLGKGQDQGLLGLYEQVQPRITQYLAEAQRGQRERDITDVEQLGPRTAAALRGADPTAMVLEDQLAKQATEGLNAGAGLDASLLAQVQQNARAAQAARGFGMGGPDISLETLMGAREAEAMRRQRQAFAMDVVARRRATTGDPFMAILGRPSATAATAGGLVGQAGGLASGAPTFDPFTAYASDVFNTNYNAKAAANIANANNQNALMGAGISAAGSAAGSV
jgi:hypothetical protein